ncbi:class F sortase [Streptomyces sp. NPDC057638]|uniref:class F sortase n=1 Tax=Streptomyces sp. NPDC057638 TaxID=3346190 RepID=UPI0036B9FA35
MSRSPRWSMPYRLGAAALLLAVSVPLTGCGALPGAGDDRPGGTKAPRTLRWHQSGGHEGREARIVALTAAVDRAVTAPGEDRVGWLTTSAVPGARGAAVLSGRAGTKESPGPLYPLTRVVVGDKATLTHADGTTTVFTVGRIQMLSRSLPTVTEAAADADGRELRIVALVPPGSGSGTPSQRAGAGAEQVGLLVSATAR